MPYSESVLHSANARLALRRAAAERARQARQTEIYTKIPRVAEIDRLLRRTMAQVIAAALKDGGDPTAAIGAVRKRNTDLQAERDRLLAANGFPADALDEKPSCAKCGDTGWVGAAMCDCLKLLCTQEQIKELSQTLDFGEQTFELFDFSFYSDLDPDAKGRTTRQKMRGVYEICWDYAHRFGRTSINNLFLSGGTGLGKTFLSACIARTVSESGFSVVYDAAGTIFQQFEIQKFSRDDLDAKEARDGTRRYLCCDLLIMDDLGSEMTTPFVQAALYQIINSRLTANKRTVISSNLGIAEVRTRYTPQIASRLEGEYQFLRFFGQDIRLQRKQRL